MTAALRDLLAAVAAGDVPAATAAPLLRGLLDLDRTAQVAAGPLVPSAEPYPLSRGQAALWAIHATTPGATSYNLPLGLWLGRDVDRDVLAEALAASIRRHPDLGVSVHNGPDGPWQRVLDRPAEVRGLDLSHVTDAEFATRVDRLTHQAFDLEDDPLHRTWLIEAPGGDWLLLLVFHHLITDGVSSHLLLRDIVACHTALAAGGPLPPLEPAAPYREFVEWQRGMLAGPEGERHRRWWAERLAGVDSAPVLDAIADHRPDAPPAHTGGEMVRLRLSEAEWAAVTAAARGVGTSTFGVVFGAFAALLHRHSGHPDISAMVPTDGRPSHRFDRTVGYLINPVVVRVACDPDMTCARLFTAVRDQLSDAEEHAAYPFAAAIDDLRRSGDPAAGVDIGFYLQQGVGGDQDMAAGQTVFRDAMELTQEGENPLVVEVVVRGPGALLYVKYDPARFDRATAEQLAEHYRLLLVQAASDPTTRLRDLAPATPGERAALARANDTRRDRPRGTSAAELVLGQVERTPGALAVADGDRTLTYAELGGRVRALATALRDGGVRPGDLVGVLVDRHVDLVTALLAVQAAGAAYVPLDPAFPAARLAHIAADAGLVAVLVDPAAAAHLPAAAPGARVRLDAVDWAAASQDAPIPGADDQLAYVLYTSGSTGKPKGVEVTHGNLANLLTAMAERPGCAAGETLLAVTTAGFDIAGLELLLPLTVGATVHVAPSGTTRDGFALAELVDQVRPTIVQATPATWRMLLAAGWSGRVPRVLCGGEALDRPLADALLGRCDELWNMYGPTETTIWSTALRVRRGRPITVGTPIANTTATVVDAEGAPVPFGAVGELLLGGDGVARGYRDRPELTSTRFVGGHFRTGDLARWTAEGELTLLGRADRQVKLRGHRVELGEVEDALRRAGGVEDARVVLREDTPGGPALIAFVVPRQDPDAAATATDRARDWLPEYMVPARTVVLERFPLTPNAKVDVGPLGARPLAELVSQFGHPAAAAPAAVPAPAPGPAVSGSGLVELLREVAAQVAGVPAASIPVGTPLGEAGFNSISFTRLAVALRERFAITVRPTAFYSHPTLTALAAHLTTTHGAVLAPAAPAAPAVVAAPRQAGRERAYPPIAVIGVGGRLPESDSIDEFWSKLAAGQDMTRPYPVERGFSDRLFPEGLRGSFVRDVDAFDAPLFRVSRREAAQMDPQQRLLLHAAHEAVLDAGYAPASLAGTRAGVFVGISGADYLSLLGPGDPGMGDHFLLGNLASIAANRISYVYDLAGPSTIFDTACSSSLVAIHRAARALQRGDCETALAGGANLLLSPHGFTGLRRAGMLSPDGRCKTFDSAADGYGRGEGVLLLMLKPLDRARADGDPVHGVLIGSAENHGGRTHSLTVPNPRAQREVVLAAHRAAAVPPDTISYVEAHGTGTPLGDPVEVDGLTDAFARLHTEWGRLVVPGRTALGSVKSAIGHLEAAAGVAGLVTVLLAMRNRVLPGLVGLGTPNPMLDLAGSPFRLQTATTPWVPPDGVPARAGISSFGMGGSNVHVVVEQAAAEAGER
ncbi:amino acid adenylation domain-containing protein [Actinokineospora sp. 24-640]